MTTSDRRVAALHRLAILDTPPESAFDDITEMAARLFRVPVACVTLVDDDRYYFKSAVGADTGSAPLEPGFCGTTVESGAMRIVEDTLENDETRFHSLVCAAPHLRFYAGVPLFTSDGHAVGTLCIMDDKPRTLDKLEQQTLSELGVLIVRRLEQRAEELAAEASSGLTQREQQVASLAALTGGLAHDFNNYLMAILGNLDLLSDNPGIDSKAAGMLDNARTAAGRATELAHQLLTFAGERSPKLERLDLADVLNSVTALVRSGLAPGVDLDVRDTDVPVWVHADPTHLRHMIVSLIINGAESYNGKPGTVSLHLQQVGNQALITVADQGCGIEAESRQHIFDPFFSTKSNSRGLGLAIAQRVINDHQGHIELQSVPGQGTRCTINLPAVQASPTVTTQSTDVEHERSPLDATVLIVDDEPDVRRFLTAAARHLGFKVLEATGGKEALSLLDHADAPPDLVLLDTSMPNVSGEVALARIHERLPELPAVVMSGHDLAQVKRRFEGLKVASFLQKPFGIAQLRTRLLQAAGQDTA